MGGNPLALARKGAFPFESARLVAPQTRPRPRSGPFPGFRTESGLKLLCSTDLQRQQAPNNNTGEGKSPRRAGSVSDRSDFTPVAHAPGSPLSPLPVPI